MPAERVEALRAMNRLFEQAIDNFADIPMYDSLWAQYLKMEKEYIATYHFGK